MLNTTHQITPTLHCYFTPFNIWPISAALAAFHSQKYVSKSVHFLIDRVYLSIGLFLCEENGYEKNLTRDPTRHLPLHDIIATQSNKIIIILYYFINSIHWWSKRIRNDAKNELKASSVSEKENFVSVCFVSYLFTFEFGRYWIYFCCWIGGWLVYVVCFTTKAKRCSHNALLSIHHRDNRSVHFYIKCVLFSWHRTLNSAAYYSI